MMVVIAQSQTVEEKEAWIQLWQFQENLCYAVNSVYRESVKIKRSVTRSQDRK